MEADQLRILLVEDDEDLAEVLVSLVKDMGYEIMRTTTSLAFRQFVDSSPSYFDLVIVDQKTPIPSGVDIAEDMVRIGPSMPVILYVDHADRALIERARIIGFCLVKKSTDPSNLLTCIRHYLQF